MPGPISASPIAHSSTDRAGGARRDRAGHHGDGHDEQRDAAAEAQHGEDQPDRGQPAPLDRGVGERLGRPGAGGAPGGDERGGERDQQRGADGDDHGDPAGAEDQLVRDHTARCQPAEQPLSERDTEQAAERGGEHGREDRLADHHPAQLAGGGADGAQQGELALPLLDRQPERGGDDEQRDADRERRRTRRTGRSGSRSAEPASACSAMPRSSPVSSTAGAPCTASPTSWRDLAEVGAGRGQHADGVDRAGVPGEPGGVGVGEERVGGGGQAGDGVRRGSARRRRSRRVRRRRCAGGRARPRRGRVRDRW